MTDRDQPSALRQALNQYVFLAGDDEEETAAWDRLAAHIDRADRIERVARDIDAATKPEDLDTLLVDLAVALHDNAPEEDR